MSKESYYTRKILKRCVRCGTQDAYTLNGRSTCAECAEKVRAYNAAYQQSGKARERQRAFREKHEAEGLCRYCNRPAEIGKKICAYHYGYSKRRNLKGSTK